MDAHTLMPAATLARKAKTPFPGESDTYRKASEALLAEEIEFRRHMTRLAEQRRALPPGPVIAKPYRFKDANGSELGLIDLFGNHDALVTYFWSANSPSPPSAAGGISISCRRSGMTTPTISA
jgi:predicted dithiol-disulfide oxidoreductase (DUF899 family)